MKTTMIAREVATLFESIAPLDSGIPGDELGFIWGNADARVNGIGCVWDLNTFSIRACVDQGLNLIICHEALWLAGQQSPWYKGPGQDRILPNLKRRELLERHGLTVYRSHSNWDALPGDGISDAAIVAVGLGKLTTVAREKFFSVQELAEPMSIEELRQRVAAGVGFAGCRIFGDPQKIIRRFSFLIGGFGENQLHMPQAAMELGAEAIIIGEMSEFIVIGCLEMGLPVVESLHSASEIPGIRRQARILAARLPGMRVEYIASGALAFA